MIQFRQQKTVAAATASSGRRRATALAVCALFLLPMLLFTAAPAAATNVAGWGMADADGDGIYNIAVICKDGTTGTGTLFEPSWSDGAAAAGQFCGDGPQA